MNGGFVCLPGADLSPDAPRAEWDPVFPRRPAGLSGPDSGWAEVSSGTRVSGRGARNPHLGPGGARQQKPLSGHICIVGHTPTVFLTDGHDEDFSIWHGDGILDIDCGCGSMKAAHRRLACLRLDDMAEFYVGGVGEGTS